MQNRIVNLLLFLSLITFSLPELNCMSLLAKKLITSAKTNLSSKSLESSQKRNFIDDIEFKYKKELYKKIKELQKTVSNSISQGVIVIPEQFGISYGMKSKIANWEAIEEKQKRDLEYIHKYIREYMLKENINPEKTENKNSNKTDISGQVWCPAHPHWPHSSDLIPDECFEKNCCKNK